MSKVQLQYILNPKQLPFVYSNTCNPLNEYVNTIDGIFAIISIPLN